MNTAPAPAQLRDHIDLMTSQKIHDDPLCTPSALEEFGDYLARYHNVDAVNSQDRRPELAEQHVYQDLRRCVQRVVAERVGASLLPVAIDLLSENDVTTGQLEELGVADVDEWEGARYRVFLGDDVKVGSCYETLFMGSMGERLFDGYNDMQIATLRGVNADLTHKVQEAAERTHQSEFTSSDLTDVLSSEPYIGLEQGSVVPMRLRTVSFLQGSGEANRTNNNLRPDIMHQLETNAVGFGEFYSSSLGTMLPYALRQAGCPSGKWLKTELGSLAPISAIAALKDGPSDEIFYTNREKQTFSIVSEDDGWVIRAIRQPLKATAERVGRAWTKDFGRIGSMSQAGRCPSNQALTPRPEVEAWRSQLIDRIDELTDGGCPDRLRAVITPADICAITGIGLVAALKRRGIVQLSPTSIKPVLRREPQELKEVYSDALTRYGLLAA